MLVTLPLKADPANELAEAISPLEVKLGLAFNACFSAVANLRVPAAGVSEKSASRKSFSQYSEMFSPEPPACLSVALPLQKPFAGVLCSKSNALYDDSLLIKTCSRNVTSSPLDATSASTA